MSKKLITQIKKQKEKREEKIFSEYKELLNAGGQKTAIKEALARKYTQSYKTIERIIKRKSDAA